jgi:hypothetical protein
MTWLTVRLTIIQSVSSVLTTWGKDHSTRGIQQVHDPEFSAFTHHIKESLHSLEVRLKHLVTQVVLDHARRMRGDRGESEESVSTLPPVFDHRKSPEDDDKGDNDAERDLGSKASTWMREAWEQVQHDSNPHDVDTG